MRVVIAYDISSDRRRKKVADLLSNVLIRVQLSVFEGDVPPEVLERWVKKAVRLLDAETDSLRVYRLCAACAPRVDVYGLAMFLEGGPVRIL
ncbi:MAG: CRISPR-associated endonuclease Cas2 [Thermoanaerobaculia bacterium]